MHARAISLVMVTLLFGVGIRALAQDGAAEEPASEERAPPTTALPVEDPTIHQERHQELQDEGSTEPNPENGASETENEAMIASEGAEDERDQTTSALPVEDPTLQVEDEVVLTPEPEPESTEKPEADWGQKVKVAYGYQGGLLVAVDDWFYLALSGLVQARYSVNYRSKPPTDLETGEREKQVTQGFDVARARFHLGIGLTEFVALYMRIGVVSGGDFSFQRAFIDLKWKYLRLRAGLFMNELIAESLINPNDHLFNDYSIVENVYGPGSSKGVMLTYLRKRFSLNLGYSDGLRTGFSEIRSPARADFAVTLRAQYAWGERGLSGFNRLIARRGTPFGIRLGGSMHYQDGGRSQGTTDVKIALGTIDLSVRGNGWSLLFSVTTGQDGRVDAADSVQTFEVVTAGLSVMGGYFVLDNLQIFAQYGVVTKPTIQGEPPPMAPGVPTDEPSNFQSFGVGLTYFVVPGHDNVKLSTDFQYFLGRETGSPVPASSLNNIQPNDDGSQFFWRLQISAAF
ncbi:MAG: hypothetical protein AMJ63_07270 [Myxococcales bacterium SG8_38_1]|jgi:hypothetical protein|nr:MAG: hypothetical protein AMJ63_07270 [Myxococcales bacterium SG8_38_1]